MKKLLTRLWPRKKPEVGILKEDHRKWFASQRSVAEKYLVCDTEYANNFCFTDETVIEYAPLALSKCPIFRDEFAYFANLVQVDHPSILKLLYWGEEDGRLCRVWKKRFLASAQVERPFKQELFPLYVEQLVSLLEALELLHAKGARLEVFTARTLSRDPNLFIARFPFTLERELPSFAGDTMSSLIDCFSVLPTKHPRLSSLHFLLQIGNFSALWLTDKAPVDKPPAIHLYFPSQKANRGWSRL